MVQSIIVLLFSKSVHSYSLGYCEQTPHGCTKYNCSFYGIPMKTHLKEAYNGITNNWFLNLKSNKNCVSLYKHLLMNYYLIILKATEYNSRVFFQHN